jgi:hypothetical protein
MTKFYIGRLWSRGDKLSLSHYTQQWFEDEHPEMFAWTSESVGGRWELETEQSPFGYEYDTGFCAYDVYIVYDTVPDAVHHKLRWS